MMRMMRTRIWSLLGWGCCFLFAPAATAQNTLSGGMARYPDVSEDAIVFVYANDLWTVPREGGEARPLASPPGPELFPRFSPDGSTIGFVGNYEGGRDLYTIPVSGGLATRITYHPAGELLCDWTPDGALLFSSNGFAGLSRQTQLFQIREEQPLAEPLPVPYGSNGAISSDGTWLAYTPWSRDTRTWKRYRGGMASDIWLYHLEQNRAQKITDWQGTDTLPMWHGQTVYYLSDEGATHRLNIWSYDTGTGSRTQVTQFSDFDVKWPSIGPGPDGNGEIVFQLGSELRLLDLESGETRVVEVTVPGDRPQLRPRIVDASEFIQQTRVSPTGKRLVIEARGDVWTVPANTGSPRNLTRTDGIAERDPTWSPDGRWIAYFSDATGEYELMVQQADGRGEARRLTENGEAYRYASSWSPDSKHLLFSDKTGALWLYTLESEELQHVDTDSWARQMNTSWSADSRWIAYDKQSDDPSGTSAIWVFDTRSGETTRLTDGMFNDRSPAFDREGKFLYFIGSRRFGSPVYEDMGTTWVYTGTELLLALPLRSDVENPLLPESDEESWNGDDEADDEENGDEESGDDEDENSNGGDENGDADEREEGADEGGADKAPPAVEIEFEGAFRRVIQLPVPAGNFGGLAVNRKNELIYGRRPPRGASGSPAIHLLDIHADDPDEKTVVSGVGNFQLTADGKMLMISRGSDTIYLVKAAADQKLEEAVSLDGMRMVIDPREEWRQVFVDAWRIQRDFFYDPHMHGVDWEAVRRHYERMLEDCTSREDVSFVIGEMIAELNVGHAYYFGGDVEEAPSASTGLPGCLFELHDGRYRIARLYEGATWDVDARNPLRSAGVKAGEYLLAVNGEDVDVDRSPWAAFQGLANRVVTLTVASDPGGEDAREVTVRLPGSDTNLRYRQWIEENRQYVEEQSDGRIGYIYVPNTGVNGQDDLYRQFFGQRHKDALIIDERWNGGGQIPTRFIELLNRPTTNYWARRDGRDWHWPPDAHQGPKCMLINGLAGSGGDMFPALFRQAGLGKLIGMRTWGGLVGISGNPRLIDGGYTAAPTFAYYETDGTWGIEGHGVDPDIEVVDDPSRMVDGGDPQLDAAIRHLQEELRRNPPTHPERPAYPDRSGFGIAPEDR